MVYIGWARHAVFACWIDPRSTSLYQFPLQGWD